MGIYQRILDLEINVVKFHRDFIVDLQPTIDESDKKLDILRASDNTEKIHSSKSILSLQVLQKKINLLREYENEIIYSMSEFQKDLALVKKDLTTDNMLSVLAEISKLQKHVLNMMNHIQYYFLKNPNVSSISNVYRVFLQKYQPLTMSVFKDAIKELNDDIAVVDAAKPNFRANFASFVEFSHVHKIELWKEIKNRKVQIKIKSGIDFSKKDYPGLKKDFTELIEKGCNYIIEKYPEHEQACLKIKSMNTQQLEEKALEIIKNTFINILDAKPEIIKSSIQRINVDLIYDATSGGTYLFKSDFTEMFLKIALNDELLYAIEINQKDILPKSEMYKNIVHELTHALDWNYNTHSVTDSEFESTAAKIIGDASSQNSARLAEILIYVRAEALAHFSEFSLSKYRTGPYTNIKINLNFGNKISFEKLIREADISPKNIDKAYNEGILHEAGILIAKIIFLDSTRGKFLYHKNVDDEKDIRTSSMLANNTVKDMLTGRAYILAAEPAAMDTEINNFIKKLSLMPPEVFLQKYEESCTNFEIEPIISKKLFKETYYKDTKQKEPQKELEVISLPK